MKKLLPFLAALLLTFPAHAQVQVLYFSPSMNQCYSVATNDAAFLATLPSDVVQTSPPCPVVVPPQPPAPVDPIVALTTALVQQGVLTAAQVNTAMTGTPQAAAISTAVGVTASPVSPTQPLKAVTP
jgi:hypothetical protein